MMDRGQAASALRWWQEAGVDTIVGETPRNWLAPAAPVSPALPAGPAAEALPDRLDDFQAWWLAGDLPGAAPSAARVAPAGDPQSGVMIMVDMPSAADVEAGALLSGEAGALFDKMLGAIGLGRDTLYLAALSPVRSATGKLAPEAAVRLALIARHHVGLVRPKALLLFGDGCAKALIGASVVQARGKWHELATPTGKISTLVTMSPQYLQLMPSQKKLAWEDLQMLREGLK